MVRLPGRAASPDSFGATGGRALAQGQSQIYTCTLAVPDAQMKTQEVDGHKEVVGVDP